MTKTVQSMMLASLALGALACRPAAPGTVAPSAEAGLRATEPVEQTPPAPEHAAEQAAEHQAEVDAATEPADSEQLAQLDTDGDGIPDSQDECPETPEWWNGYDDEDGCPDGCRLDPCAIRFHTPMRFVGNGAELDDASQIVLDDLAQVLRDNPDITIAIFGHTDSGGSSKANLQLSERRAIRIRDDLIDKGIAAERLIAKGHGENMPADTNRTAEGRANNRRVEVQRTDNPDCPPP